VGGTRLCAWTSALVLRRAISWFISDFFAVLHLYRLFMRAQTLFWLLAAFVLVLATFPLPRVLGDAWVALTPGACPGAIPCLHSSILRTLTRIRVDMLPTFPLLRVLGWTAFAGCSVYLPCFMFPFSILTMQLPPPFYLNTVLLVLYGRSCATRLVRACSFPGDRNMTGRAFVACWFKQHAGDGSGVRDTLASSLARADGTFS